MDVIEFNRLIHKFKKVKTAFDELYNYFFPRIRIYIGRKYNDFYMAEDIAQEFFLKLFRITIPEKILHPTSWIFNACDNLAKSHISTHKNIQDSLLYMDELVAADKIDYSENLKNGGISEENIEALKQLDGVTIEIFVMHYWEGYNYKEIAEILGLNHEQVRKKASRGIRKLKKFYILSHTLILISSLFII